MESELLDYGLSDKEVKIYLICLKVGEATANRISEISDLARSTVYDVLDKLKQYGLITTCVVESKIHFIASDPEVLITNLDEKKKNVKKVLPDLRRVKNKIGERPVAEVFQGKVSIIKLLDEILDNAKSVKVMGSMGNAMEKIGYHPEAFRVKRIDKKIFIKQILEISSESKKIKDDKYTNVKYLKSFGESKEGTFIYGGIVVHFDFQYELTAIKITSKDHARASEIMFDELWKIAKK